MSLLADELSVRVAAMATVEDERRELRARLFGPLVPEDADAVTAVTAVALGRDALARAARCVDEDDLVRLLEVAEAGGDEQLARAAAGVGFHRGWVEVVDRFEASRPAAAADLGRLWTLLATEAGMSEGEAGWR